MQCRVLSTTAVILTGLLGPSLTFLTAQPTTAAVAPEPKVVEISVKAVESYVPGCTNCPRSAVRTPIFSELSSHSALAGALKIVAHSSPPNVYQYATSAGGCAISATRALLCWGANGAGQLGNGTNDAASSPTPAVGIGDVSDVAASGATTCAVSGGDLYCAGLGPWPGGTTTSSAWVKLNEEPVSAVLQGNHISSSVRSPVCVVTAAQRFKCLRTTTASGQSAVFSWIDSNLPDVTDAESSLVYYPGQSNMCVLSEKKIVCGTVDKDASFSVQQRIKSGTEFTRVYMFDWGYPAVCGWSNGLLSCGNFSYTPSSPYSPPGTLRVVGVVPEPLSMAYREVDTIRRVYMFHSNGVLHIGVGFLESTTYAFGSADSIIAPVLGWGGTTADASMIAVSVSGPTNTAALVPVGVSRTSRSLLGSRNITVTSNGLPLVGSRVTWTTTDDPAVLQSSTAASYTTDSMGQVRFPQMASGAVTFTVWGGRVSGGAFLQSAVATVEVGAGADINVRLPAPPQVVTRRVSVRLPDSTAVPNAEIRLKNAFLTFGFANEASARAAWSAQQPDAMSYLSTVVCPFCMVNPPTYLTDASGTATIPTFSDVPRGAEHDASASFDDGVIAQSVNITTLLPETTATFQFMQSIRMDAVTSTALKTGGSTTLTGKLVDDLGNPIPGVTLSVEEVCDEVAFGGLWKEGQRTSEVPCRSGITARSSAAGVRSEGLRCRTSAATDSRGAVRIPVCISSSVLVRVSARGYIAGRTICLKVGRSPCQASFTPASAEEAGNSINVRRGKKMSAREVAVAAGMRPARDASITLAEVSTASGRCAVSPTSVKGNATGFCRIRVTVKPKGKKSATRLVLLRAL